MRHFLNARSHFSIGESVLRPKQIVEQAKAAGYSGVALCDTMNITGMIEFTKAAKEAGVTPLIGVRLQVVNDPSLRDKKADNGTFYPKLYPRTAEGMRRLFGLLSTGFEEDHFYFTPRVALSEVLDVLDAEHFCVSSGCVLSAFHRRDYIDVLCELRERVSASQCFVELQPVDTPLYDTLTLKAINAAYQLALPTLVTRPALYPKGDAALLDIMTAISDRVKIADKWHKKPANRDLHIMGPAELLAEVKAQIARLRARGETVTPDLYKQGLQNNDVLAEMLAYRWEKQPISMPEMAEDEFGAVVASCKAGWRERFTREVFGHKPTKEELVELYQPRLKRELATLKDMGFCRYFLLVEDLVKWSKSQGIIVGPGRGSVGGSLVAYLMGITEVDPIRFNLLFERFINPERLDLPDADLDFMSTRRHEVLEYLNERYGVEHVAGIANYSTLGASSALRDVGRVYDVSQKDLSCSKLVPKQHGISASLAEAAEKVAEIDKFRQEHEEVWKHAVALDDIMRSYAKHAAGIVVAGEPVRNRAVVERRKNELTVNWDKRIVEDMGLVKMDILGLSTLDTLKIACDMVQERSGEEIDLLALPLDDAKVLGAFAKGQSVGVFQFESSGMRKLLRDLGRDGNLSFEDISAATALYRPGPMDSGLLDEYVQIKKGHMEPAYEHPAMEPALSATNSVLVYQEQVMQLARDLAGFTMADADHLRKAMGKKDAELMAKQRAKWSEGCVAVSGLSEKRAAALFDRIEKFAGYAFNRSHAVEYSLISYQAMWLKVYYPLEFYAASLTTLAQSSSHDRDAKIAGLIRDAEDHDVQVLPPSINHSTARFEIASDKHLVIPFNAAKGISDNTTNAILEARKAGKFTSVEDFLARVEKRKCNVRHQDILRRVGAFVCIDPAEAPALDPSRLKDQMELLPGLFVGGIAADRDIPTDEFTRAKLAKIIKEWRGLTDGPLADTVRPVPQLGQKAKFMVITDGPQWSEEQNDKLATGESFAFMSEALAMNDLRKSDAYFTTLVKCPKPEGEKFYPNDMINASWPYLQQEIELLKPPVIVLLGTATVRHFLKGIKGPVLDHAGKVQYDRALDASLVIGFNPAMIAFDDAKQRVLNEIMGQVKEMVL